MVESLKRQCFHLYRRDVPIDAASELAQAGAERIHGRPLERTHRVAALGR
jgi:hypothetical protein